MKKEKLRNTSRLLIIVDVINGFLTTGVLHDKYINRITPHIIKLLKNEFINEDDLVIFGNDAHTENAVEFKRFGNTKHAVKDTYEAEVVDSLKPFVEGAWVINKNSTSLYVTDEFRDALGEMDSLKEVVIVGDCTDMCVMDLALPLMKHFEERDREVRIVAPTDHTETFENEDHERDEWNYIARRVMNQAGIETPKEYVKRM